MKQQKQDTTQWSRIRLILSHLAFLSYLFFFSSNSSSPSISSSSPSDFSFVSASTSNPSDPLLRFHPFSSSSSSSVFTILQLADLHFGEAENLDWGPEQDRKSSAAIQKYVDYEDSEEQGIDLVVYSGDLITGNNIARNHSEYWTQVVQQVQKPFATVFGNHDDQYNQTFLTHVDSSVSSNFSLRRHLMDVDISLPFSYSCCHRLDSILQQACCRPDLPGVSNYFLPLLSSSSSSSSSHLDVPPRLLALIWFLDSGGGSIPEMVYESQVEYIKTTSPIIKQYFGIPNDEIIPSILFLHIPPLQYYSFAPNPSPSPSLSTSPSLSSSSSSPFCIGTTNDSVSTIDDGFLLNELFELDEGISGVFVGHYHGNDWCCEWSPDAREKDEDGDGFVSHSNNFKPWSLCYGRHSGYGGYGEWDRGARVIQFQFTEANTDKNEPAEVSWKSWIRMEDGTKINEWNGAMTKISKRKRKMVEQQ